VSAEWQGELARRLRGGNAVVKVNEPLCRHTSFRIGGPAAAWVEVGDTAALELVVRFCAENRIALWVLGAGTNVLVSDQGLAGVVVRLGGQLAAVRFEGDRVRAGAGALLAEIVAGAEEHGLVGVEFLAGIPGTVGGALRTNAGAFGHSLADVVESVTALDRAGRLWTIERDGLRSEYRRPVIEASLIVLEVVLKLTPGRSQAAQEWCRQRRLKHPDEASAGSFFQNPKQEPAGSLIERCGLKGRSIGGAKVSEKHANFIVNTGTARFQDVYELSQLVKAVVEERTGIVLEEEVLILPGPAGGPALPDASARR